MATLYGNTIWDSNSQETKPTYEQGARNGQFLKELDTGDTYHRINGIWQYLNLGLASIKVAKSGRITTDANGETNIVFNTQFINEEYSIVLNVVDDGGKTPIASECNRSIDGFTIRTRNTTSGQLIGNAEVSWLAIKDYNP